MWFEAVSEEVKFCGQSSILIWFGIISNLVVMDASQYTLLHNSISGSEVDLGTWTVLHMKDLDNTRCLGSSTIEDLGGGGTPQKAIFPYAPRGYHHCFLSISQVPISHPLSDDNIRNEDVVVRPVLMLQHRLPRLLFSLGFFILLGSIFYGLVLGTLSILSISGWLIDPLYMDGTAANGGESPLTTGEKQSG